MSGFGGLWKHEKTQHFNYLGLGSATLLQLAFLGESDPNFPWDKVPFGQQSGGKKERKNTHITKLRV